MKSQESRPFLFGAAVSTYQVSGAHTHPSEWDQWEVSSQRRTELVKNGESSENISSNFVNGHSTGHHNLYRQDYQAAKELGMNALRISVEWSQVCPKPGYIDTSVLLHYKEQINTLRELNIEPIVTLWHFDLPVWISKNGGWSNNQTVNHFKEFVKTVVETLHDKVSMWITINEPEIYPDNAYINGSWPPNQRNPFLFAKVARNIIKAHHQAAKVIKNIQPESMVGVSHNIASIKSDGGNYFKHLYAGVFEKLRNLFYLNKMKDSVDFIGVNFYFTNIIGNSGSNDIPKSDLGWELRPGELKNVIKKISEYNLPILITENGLADADDSHRSWFLEETFKALDEVRNHDISLLGYLHWSLLDNFEWHHGKEQRFGLIEVDYKTLARRARASAETYKDLIAERRDWLAT